MLYQYISFPDGTEINHSEVITDGENNKVRVYVEQWNKNINDFNILEVYLPECNITKLQGFTNEVATRHLEHIRNLKNVIWECALERDGR